MGTSFGGIWAQVATTALTALVAAACGDATSSPKSPAAGASGSTNSTAGKSSNAGGSSTGGGLGDGGTGAGQAQGGNAALAGSSSQGAGSGSSPVGGAGVGEQVCSTDPEHCFDVVHQQWPGTGNAGVDGVAFDSQGNLVVAASTVGSLARVESYKHQDFLINWTPQLKFVGALQQTGISRALALDSNDNAFRVGVVPDDKMVSTAGLDLAITKSAPDGTETWRKVLASPQYDEARSMATDSDGNCYIGGFTFGKFADDAAVGLGDALLVKIAPNGDRLWAHQFGSTEFDSLESICVDSAGNSYVTGGVAGTFASAGLGDNDLYIAKFSPSGEQLWAKQVGGAALDTGTGVACGADFVYVVGVTKGRLDDPQAAAPKSIDLVLLKYDAAGTQEWLKQWLTSGNENYPKVAVGLNGNAIVAGVSATDLDGAPANGPGGETDLFIGEWGVSGDPLWVYQWGSDSWDSAMAVAVSPTGRIAVGAMTQGPLPQFANLGSGGGVLSVFTPR